MGLYVDRIQNLGGASVPRVPATDPSAIDTIKATMTPIAAVAIETVVAVLVNWEGGPLECIGGTVRVLVFLVVLKCRVE